MPVVINEFEVIAEPPASPSPQESPATGGTQPERNQPIRAIDILHIVERQEQRLARIYAD